MHSVMKILPIIFSGEAKMKSTQATKLILIVGGTGFSYKTIAWAYLKGSGAKVPVWNILGMLRGYVEQLGIPLRRIVDSKTGRWPV